MNEPSRHSFLDVIRTNLKAGNRTIFVTRLIYFGVYYSTPELIQQRFNKIVENLSNEYTDEPITGLLVVYPQYFVHLIEASEENIFRHFVAMFETPETFGPLIPLPTYHHVNHRFFKSWLKISTKPPSLLEKLESSGYSEVEKQTTNCLSKVYRLCEYIMDNSATNAMLNDTLTHLGERAPQYLPESTVLEFLLNAESIVLMDVREFLDKYLEVPFVDLYRDKIWPATCDFVPYDIFEERAIRKDLMPIQPSTQQPRQYT